MLRNVWRQNNFLIVLINSKTKEDFQAQEIET